MQENPTEPLLGDPLKPMSDAPPQALSSTTRTAIKALSIVRILTGAACIIAPRFTCALFRYNVPAEQTLLVRMFGVRDTVFGELLITAEHNEKKDCGRRQVPQVQAESTLTVARELRRAIWAGIAADVVDIGSLAFGVAMGQVGKATGGLLGAAAVGAIGLAAVGLLGL